jgi:hypothetical protein
MANTKKRMNAVLLRITSDILLSRRERLKESSEALHVVAGAISAGDTNVESATAARGILIAAAREVAPIAGVLFPGVSHP